MSDNIHEQKQIRLDKAIRRQVGKAELAPDELAGLMRMQEKALAQPAAIKRPAVVAAVAAGVLLVASALFVQFKPNANPYEGYPGQIAAEVVENHLKLKPLDVQASSIVELQNFFTQLDFRPATSSLFDAGEVLLGGRYCSIKGVTAAQLRYDAIATENPDDISTLYQVAYSAEQFGPMPRADNGEAPLVIMSKGLEVSMWVEKGLLMVRVQE